MEGQRPEKPKNAADIGLSDQVWSLMGSCWVHDPSQRLKIPEVVHKFTRIFKRATREESGPKPPAPPKDGNDALRKVCLFFKTADVLTQDDFKPSGGVPPLPNNKPRSNSRKTSDYPPQVTSLQRVQSPPVIAAPAVCFWDFFFHMSPEFFFSRGTWQWLHITHQPIQRVVVAVVVFSNHCCCILRLYTPPLLMLQYIV
jgi:hypothetical protein